VVRVLWFLTLLIDHDLAILTSNDETLGVSDDTLNVEMIARALS